MSLYNCKSDGDHYRISKFSNDLDVEASYLTDGAECDCPAGHRPVCRHRIMLPRFIAKNATAGQWFHNYEHNQWVRALSDDEPKHAEQFERVWEDKPINLLDLARPVSPMVTTTDFDSVDNGSTPLLAANETKPLRRL